MQVSRLIDNVYVLDDFLQNPDVVRQEGLNTKYIDWTGPDGQIYKRISHTIQQEVCNLLQDIFGKYDLLGMAFRLNYDNELPNQSIHSDMGWGSHALVLYLTDGPSGTAFWHHTKSNRNNILPDDIELFDVVKDDFEKEDAWDQRAFVKMKYNRALIYSSDLFHSRYPFKAFGNSIDNGRLILVAFFTPLGDSNESPSS